MASVYESLGLRPVINASGTLTRLGGSRMAPETLAAMAEAAASFVPIDELQTRAGEVIAAITGAEAGYVVAGAAAGLSLATAACVAGMDVAAMDRLPDTTGMKNEIVVQRGHRNAYDHAIRAAGVRFVEVGYLGFPGAGGTQPWQIADAITERTAAVACPVLDTPGTVPLPLVCAIAHAHGVPVIVDAAAELPPRSNLRRFLAEGADLVVFSGGKAIAGPQASGILAGRADLIVSVALQHQDMDVRPATWTRRDLIAGGAVAGVPNQGFGRAMKVGREEIVGLVVALRRFAAGSDEADFARWSALLDAIEATLRDATGIRLSRFANRGGGVPLLAIDLAGDDPPAAADAAVNALLAGEPRVAVGESHAERGRLTVSPQSLTDDEAEIVAGRLRTVLEG
ncbi:MAG TPA: aminotransferase class V-fold PLP-dependent enzyme [Thermomicrobiales bacterium]|nr:aminotransferase class V-fold PLP-dependent enzyme [Thermomicrobiales bacterium]